jgi:hypothetical protein
MRLPHTPIIASSIFAGIAIGAWLYLVPYSSIAISHTLFYAILLINTFFSITFLSQLPVLSLPHTVLDLTLGGLYIILAMSIGRPGLFEAISLALFAFATTKYALLSKAIHLRTIRKKIIADCLGACLCAAGLTASLTGYPLQSAWAMTVILAIATLYVLILSPIYRTEQYYRTSA